LFAALTAIFAKIGVEGINSDLVTLIRTAIVLMTLAAILFATGELTTPGQIPAKSWLFLVLSALGAGASWLCYFRALKLGPATLVAPIDKLSVVLVAAVRHRLSRRAPIAAGLDRHRPDRERRGADRDQGAILRPRSRAPRRRRSARCRRSRAARPAA
jgi:uncharacterized membrane protein